MSPAVANPFTDPDRQEIWEMLVRRDIQAFARSDWAEVAGDFDTDTFFAIDGQASYEPTHWSAGLSDLDSYRETWLAQRRQLTNDVDSLILALHAATSMSAIDVTGDVALAHKWFDGTAPRDDGSLASLQWRTVYYCRHKGDQWKIQGFVGYLPHPHPSTLEVPVKHAPRSEHHSTAGPYSPVLVIDAGRLVVISGQGALDETGRVIGDTIQEQARITLLNCERQLAAAGCTFADVFKTNVYLRNLDDWEDFNAVYRASLPDPLPVRTAIGVELLSTMRVEVEMWAAKP